MDVALALTALIRGLAQGSVYVLLGLGFVIIYRGTQVINFAQPSLMILGAYFTSVFAFGLGWPFAVALLLGIAATALVGATAERIALRPMVGRPVFAAAIVTIGVFIALQALANRFVGLERRQIGDPWGLQTFVWGGATVFHREIATLLISAVAVVALGLFLKYARAGLAMRAVAFDQEVSLAQGINVGRMFATSWAISGGLAAVAGMFVGASGGGIDLTTAFVALKALPAIVLGGLDSVRGAVVGGLVIGLAEAFTKAYQPGAAPWLGANFDQVVPYLLLLLILLVRPYGLFGTPEVERV